MTFYHYTCTHGLADILADDSTLRPGLDGLLWVTDLDFPIREALGLTMNLTACDRTEHRFKLNSDEGVIPYTEFRKKMPEDLKMMLELTPGVMVRHWFIATGPVPATHAPLR